MNTQDKHPPPRALVWAGGIALFAAMTIDAIAVIGRHVGLPLLGSIELVQAAVLVSGSIALLVATLAFAHARVHFLVERLPLRLADALHRAGVLLAALLCAALCYASFVIAQDLWLGFEESELLHVPYRPLRVLVVAVLATLTVLFAVQALRRKSP